MDRKVIKPKTIKVKSYANIAIIKYWGKKDKEKMIPATSSISLTLENMFTETEISFITEEESKKELSIYNEKILNNKKIYSEEVENSKKLYNREKTSENNRINSKKIIDNKKIENNEELKDLFYLNGVLQNKEQRDKISKVINLFRQDKNKLVKVNTTNNMPTEAGLSSSSSGLSALIKACNKLFNKNIGREELAKISKFASGSSARSFFGPIGAWDKDTGAIYEIKTDLKFAMIMLVLNDEKKIINSRNGMELCMKTSTTFDDWIKQSEIDFINMKKYLANNDFEKIGILTEENAKRMHSTTLTANPPFSYLTEESKKAMEYVQSVREKGEKCYFTMDAGPNVKVLCLEKDLEKLSKIFSKKYRIIVSKTKVISDEED